MFYICSAKLIFYKIKKKRFYLESVSGDVIVDNLVVGPRIADGNVVLARRQVAEKAPEQRAERVRYAQNCKWKMSFFIKFLNTKWYVTI